MDTGHYTLHYDSLSFFVFLFHKIYFSITFIRILCVYVCVLFDFLLLLLLSYIRLGAKIVVGRECWERNENKNYVETDSLQSSIRDTLIHIHRRTHAHTQFESQRRFPATNKMPIYISQIRFHFATHTFQLYFPVHICGSLMLCSLVSTDCFVCWFSTFFFLSRRSIVEEKKWTKKNVSKIV